MNDSPLGSAASLIDASVNARFLNNSLRNGEPPSLPVAVYQFLSPLAQDFAGPPDAAMSHSGDAQRKGAGVIGRRKDISYCYYLQLFMGSY